MALGPRAGVIKDTVAQEAFALAMTLVKGWNADERGPIQEALEDFREASAHNEKARLEAEKACKELASVAAAQKAAAQDLLKRETKLADDREAFEEEKAEHNDRITSLSRKLANDRQEFESYRRDRDSNLSVREKEARDTKGSADALISTARTVEAQSKARDKDTKDRAERIDVFVKAMSELVDSWNPK